MVSINIWCGSEPLDRIVIFCVVRLFVYWDVPIIVHRFIEQAILILQEQENDLDKLHNSTAISILRMSDVLGLSQIDDVW